MKSGGEKAFYVVRFGERGGEFFFLLKEVCEVVCFVFNDIESCAQIEGGGVKGGSNLKGSRGEESVLHRAGCT